MLSLKFLSQLDWSISATLSVRRRSLRVGTVQSLPSALPSRPLPSSPPPSPMLGPGLAKTLPSNVVCLSSRRKAG
jgi:hypothetical protein